MKSKEFTHLHKTTGDLRKDFEQLIQDRKAKGVSPVFRILDDFNIGLSIGKGAFASVHRSLHRETGYSVALKVYEKKKLKSQS